MSSPPRPAPIHHAKKQRSIFEPGDVADIKKKHLQEQLKAEEEERKRREEAAAARRAKERQDSYKNGLYGNRKELMGGDPMRKSEYDEEDSDDDECHHHGMPAVLQNLKNLFKREEDPYAATYERNETSDNPIGTTFTSMAVGVTLAGMLGNSATGGSGNKRN